MRTEILDALQFAFEIGEEGQQLLFRRRRRLLRRHKRQAAGAAELEPFVAHDHHRLRQIERSEGRVDRQRHDRIGETDLVVFQAVALAPEHQRDLLTRRNARRRKPRGLVRAEYRLGLVMRARGRGDHEMAIGDRLGEGGVNACGLQHPVGAGRHDRRLPARPAAARIDETQFRQAEIRHRARGRPDILAELRLDQNHHRRRLRHPVSGLVRTCTRHILSAAAISRDRQKWLPVLPPRASRAPEDLAKACDHRAIDSDQVAERPP